MRTTIITGCQQNRVFASTVCPDDTNGPLHAGGADFDIGMGLNSVQDEKTILGGAGGGVEQKILWVLVLKKGIFLISI